MAESTLIFAFRAVFWAAALVSFFLALIVTGSLFFAEFERIQAQYILVSLMVSAAFIGLGALLARIVRQTGRLAYTLRDLPGTVADEARHRLLRVVTLLLTGGLGLLLVLGAVAFGAVLRVQQGFAIIG
ncbi:hypothetical protein KHP62_10100 [Rhodobacteraceae bacterium NNCM2]|nr:hypothetical protein [Coraliihabitans acroporae]